MKSVLKHKNIIKTLFISLLMSLGFLSCKNTKKRIDKVEIAKQYFQTFDHTDYSKMTTWFADSLTTKEGEYIQKYALYEYIEFLKWDAVFTPTYKILDIKSQGNAIKATISKTCKRISFLHETPIITNQLIKFRKDKIISIEIDYLNFNYETFGKNKDKLLKWIDKNHPELNGFINNQTETGGLKYLKAIELYKSKK